MPLFSRALTDTQIKGKYKHLPIMDHFGLETPTQFSRELHLTTSDRLPVKWELAAAGLPPASPPRLNRSVPAFKGTSGLGRCVGAH